MRLAALPFTFLLAFFFVFPHSAFAGEGYVHFLTLYDALLKTHVRPAETDDGITYNGVDYGAWANDSRHAEARRILLSEEPASHYTEDRRKSFWINAYNFLTIDLIVRTGERKSIKNLGGFFSSPWTKYHWASGKSVTPSTASSTKHCVPWAILASILLSTAHLLPVRIFVARFTGPRHWINSLTSKSSGR